jgi:hypothetical protein
MKGISDGMVRLLKTMAKDGGVYAGAGPGNSVSRLVALRNRGFVTSNGPGGRWTLTPAGREAIGESRIADLRRQARDALDRQSRAETTEAWIADQAAFDGAIDRLVNDWSCDRATECATAEAAALELAKREA